MQDNFPIIKIVPTGSLVLHEYTDPVRVKKMKKRFASKAAVLKNPILVSKMPGGKYVVLDGANRTTVLNELNVPHAVVQLVEYKQPKVLLKTWNHLIVDPRFKKIFSGSQKSFSHGDLEQMDKFVHSYKGRYKFYRVVESSFSQLRRQYKYSTCLVIFPKFSPKDIVKFTARGHRIPSGITRHVIQGRALRLPVPLEFLRSSKSLARKNQWLVKLVSDIVKNNQVRYYEEPVFIFDE